MTQSPTVESFFHEPTNSLTHLVYDPGRKRAALIDPVLDFDLRSGRRSTPFIDGVIARVKALGLTLDWILETHVHADHLTAAPQVKEALGGTLCIGRHVTAVQQAFKPLFAADDLATDGSQFDRRLSDDEQLPLGDLWIEVIATPGHTPACVSYRIGDALFVGDTLFMPDYGTARCDFPGGDAATLYRSIRRLLALPPQTRLFVCHDYKAPGRDRFAWETTVGEQRAANVHIKDGVTEAEFVAFRQGRDEGLPMPALILPAVQVNMRAGELPPPQADGHRYLLLPLDRL